MELISVIVPVYKVEQYLNVCIGSIVNQTYRNLEIILVDDGSPDNCGLMCDIWAEKDYRIRVIHQKNGGAASARNTGLDLARGEYIGFVDSDDMIRPEMYELLWDALKNSRKKLAYGYMGWKPDGISEEETPKFRELDPQEAVNEILTGKVGTSVCCRLYHRSVWDGLRFPVGDINEDFPPLIPTTVAAGGTVLVLSRIYFYRKNPGSVTDSYWKSGCEFLLKNYRLMHDQIINNRLDCLTQFREFALRGLLSASIILEKHRPELADRARADRRQVLRIMGQNTLYVLSHRFLRTKDKLLYLMVVTRTLRPIYRLLGKL